jgi:hypothetical protein
MSTHFISKSQSRHFSKQTKRMTINQFEMKQQAEPVGINDLYDKISSFESSRF